MHNIAISSAGAKSATALVTKRQVQKVRQSIAVKFLIGMIIGDFGFFGKMSYNQTVIK